MQVAPVGKVSMIVEAPDPYPPVIISPERHGIAMVYFH